jgi:hypothetical protein
LVLPGNPSPSLLSPYSLCTIFYEWKDKIRKKCTECENNTSLYVKWCGRGREQANERKSNRRIVDRGSQRDVVYLG